MSRYDAVIIGAGPGGSTAAYILAGAGMRVALIDKASFPRDKLCAGMLSERTEKTYKNIFGDGFRDLCEYSSSGARFFYKAQLTHEVRDYRKIYFTMRSYFDHHLVRLACARGAALLENTAAVSLDPGSGSIRAANGTALQADFIIGADGAISIAARNLSLAIPQNRQAVGLEIEYPREGKMAGLDRPEIYFGVIRWGYGWVVPKRNSVTIGIAGLAHKNRSLRDTFRTFLEQVCPKVPSARWKGHPIPFCDFTLRPGKGNILLVGDAAGFVEPVTGEGISFAMQSASFAAQAILDAAANGDPSSALANYRRRYEKLAHLLTQAKRMRYLVFPAISEKLLAKVLQRSKSIVPRYMDLAADELDYADFCRFLIKRLALHFFR